MDRKKFFNISSLLAIAPFVPKSLLAMGKTLRPKVEYPLPYTKQGWDPTLQSVMVKIPRLGWPMLGMELLDGKWLYKYLSTKSKLVCSNYMYSTVYEYMDFEPDGIYRRARFVQYLGAKVNGEITEQVVQRFCNAINEACDVGDMYHGCLELPFAYKSDEERLKIKPDCKYTLHFYALVSMDVFEFRKKHKYAVFEGEWPRYFI